jgi:hypothetical protein
MTTRSRDREDANAFWITAGQGALWGPQPVAVKNRHRLVNGTGRAAVK